MFLYSDRVVMPGLERINLFLEKLGQPQNKFSSILVAGTNGKGSTVNFLFEALKASGVRAAAYLSPHLFRLAERILLPWGNVEDKVLEDLIDEMAKKSEEWKIPLSPFEILTASCFLLFSSYGIELAIMEAGMGGRWDATNASFPILSIVTSIGKDHTEYLGKTLEKIAIEKLGITRKDTPLILGPIHLTPLKAVRPWLRARKIPWNEWGREFRAVGLNGSESVLYVGETLKTFRLERMRGWHQLFNASLALRALEQLNIRLDKEVINALSNSYLPGRFEWGERDGVPIILDVAHNLEGLEFFFKNMKFYFSGRPLFIFFVFLKDKPWSEMITLMRGHSEAFYSIFLPDERVVPEAHLRELGISIVRSGSPLFLKVIAEARDRNGVVAFVGSFAAVREGKKWLDGDDCR